MISDIGIWGGLGKIPLVAFDNAPSVGPSLPTPEFSLSAPTTTHTMNSHLLEEALKHVPNQQVLVNIVSKRVRQLNQGSRPLVDAPMRAGFADIAFQEVIEGKLGLTYPEQPSMTAAV